MDGQTRTSFKFNFIVAEIKHMEGQNEIVAIFHVSAKDSIDFKQEVFFPNIELIDDSGKIIIYEPSLDNVVVLTQRDQIHSTFTYELVKEKVDLNAKPFYLLSFILKDLPNKIVRKMIFSFPVRENPKSKKKKKKKFEIEL